MYHKATLEEALAQLADTRCEKLKLLVNETQKALKFLVRSEKSDKSVDV